MSERLDIAYSHALNRMRGNAINIRPAALEESIALIEAERAKLSKSKVKDFPANNSNPNDAIRSDIQYLQEAIKEMVPAGMNKALMQQAIDNIATAVRIAPSINGAYAEFRNKE